LRVPWKDDAGEYTGIGTSVDQLSSLEAAAQALGQLDGVPGHVGRLLDAFDGFVAEHGACVRA
jgi:hypothetical protein